MRRFKKILSIILLVAIITPLIPIGEIVALAVGDAVESISIFRTSNNLGAWEDNVVHIQGVRGANLSNTTISYMEHGGDIYIPLSPALPGSTPGFRQFKIPSDKTISSIRVGDVAYGVPETNMPNVTSVDPKQVDLSIDNTEVTIKGNNFEFFTFTEPETTINIANQDLTQKFISEGAGGAVTLVKSDLDKLSHGNKNIVIKRERTQGSGTDAVKISTIYNQNNAFRIFESIDIQDRDATIYPNRGQIGSETTITIDNKKENYSIFFLEEETSLFKYENMGESPEYQQTGSETKSIIKVKIPKGLTPGKTYKVFITNNLDKIYGGSKAGDDLTNNVYKQKNIGEFYVVEANVGPIISGTNPTEGTSAGSYVTINGYRLDELKISGLTVDGNDVEMEEPHEILQDAFDAPTKLRINYKTDSMEYNGDEVGTITRDFLVTIGTDAVFEKQHIDKNNFRPGDNGLDQLYVRTKTIDPKDLKDPKKDVIVSMTTTITTKDGKTFTFTETPSYYGYTFLPSYQEPIIESVTPDKIQVVSEDNPETKNTTILSIQGQNFNVLRYNKDGEMRTNYPSVVIGGDSDLTGQIIIEKDWEGKVWYRTKGSSDPKEIPNAILEVLDRNGNTVTGVGGNEVGNSIAITIPKGLSIAKETLNKPLPIAVANPKRDSEDKGDLYSSKPDIIQFVTDVSTPTIDSLYPYIVTVEGGEDITIEGRGFMDGIEVYIGGQKVPNVTRDIDKQSTRGVLKFKAPKGKEGETILQVMNPDGGTDTHVFIYVETLRIDPKITSITPPKGTEDDVIIIKGDNFLKPDPTVPNTSGINMSKIIGTRVFLGDEEVNQYVASGGLEPYRIPELTNEPLLVLEENPFTKTEDLYLSPHYKQAIVTSAGASYKVSKDQEGSIIIIGKDKTYSFYLEDDKIMATDGSLSHEVELVIGGFRIGGNRFEVDYDYSLFTIDENQYGVKGLKVADYYDSLILNEAGKYYKITKNELDIVTITDEKDNTYEIKVKGDKIVGTKGSNSFDITVNLDSVEFDGKTFDFETPYYFDPTTKIITGHRVRVLSRNEIEIIVPEKQIAGLYDVRVQNPDTKSFTVKKGFEYTKPQQSPIIHYIDPAEGSVDGGYYITIRGENFGDNPEVRIDGVLVAPRDTTVNKQDYKSIKVLVPRYTGDIDSDFITDKKYVRVHVTTGGASASRRDLFAYKLASSKPKITRVLPTKGSSAGGNVVEIYGEDFRFFEPYKGNPPKQGDTNYEDIDGNGKWTNYLTEEDLVGIPLNDPTIKDYTHYVDSPVLPSIYFGDTKARIVEFTKLSGDNYRIMVLAPQTTIGGAVDVYLRNNDSGQSNMTRYTYESSNPNIRAINPATGKRVGGETIDIVGSGYQGSKITLVGPTGVETETTTYLVRFGEITNRNINREDENSGLIKGPVGAKVELKDSGFTAEIKGNTLSLTLEQEDKVYRGTYKLGNEVKFIDLKSLKDLANKPYPGFELVKVEINDGRLLIDRGFSPTVSERVRGTLEVISPSSHQIGNVNVTLVNPDGVSNKRPFNYVSPGSNPKITNITKDGTDPISADNGKARIVQVNNKGGNLIRVIGSDFRPNPTITIGNEFIRIPSSDIEFISETELSFRMPAVTDEDKLNGWHNLIVLNEDLGSARSDQSIPTPIYFEFTKGESDPTVGNIVPDRGPGTGGTKVTITGGDFRETMENFDGKLKVYFGDVEATDVEFNNYGSITVTAPPSNRLGPVAVKIENPDGTQTMGNAIFTYISKPKINDIDPKKLFTNDTKTVVTITGEQFLPGAKVIVGGRTIPTKDVKSDMVLNGSGITGVDSDGKNIESSVVGGKETATAVVEDDGTIKVTFAEGIDIENTSIIIINPDGGISEPFNDFRYEKPVPLKPMVLEAIPGYESTVQLLWNESDPDLLNKATRYEIYGRKTSDKENTFLGDTESAGFLVKGLEPNTEYEFLVRALNEHGAAIDFATVKVKTLSAGEDKKLKEKEEKRKQEENKIKTGGKEEMQGGRLVITLGTNIFKNGVGTLDLSLAKYKNQDKFTIAIPIELARTDNRLTIKEGTLTTTINARDLYTLSVSGLDNGDKDAYLRIHMDRTVEQHIPRGKRAASKAYELYFDYIYGKDSIVINEMLRNGKLFLTQDTITYPNKKNIAMYRFNVETGNYTNLKATTTDIKGKSKFILLSDR